MALLILQLLAIALLASVAYAAASGAPWVPTRRTDLEVFVAALDLADGTSLYELGCGDGRVCLAIARRFPSVRVVGIELSIPQWLAAQWRLRRSGLHNVRLQLGNAFKTDLRDADVVYTFLMPETNARLAKKFLKELRPGTRVYTYVFGIEGWLPRRTINPLGTHRIHEFVVPTPLGLTRIRQTSEPFV